MRATKREDGKKEGGARARGEIRRKGFARHAPGAPKVNLGNQIKAVFLAEDEPQERKERTDGRTEEEVEETSRL